MVDKDFIGFIKTKGLYVEAPKEQPVMKDRHRVDQINMELMAVGYILTEDLFYALTTLDNNDLNKVYNDLMKGIKRVIGEGSWTPIYQGFPQSVRALSRYQFVINALIHYWSAGSWRPEDAEHVNREFSIEVADYKEVRLLSKQDFEKIFTDILHSGTSITSFDKECLDYAINNGLVDCGLSSIKFKETLAYVGQRLVESKVDVLPTKNATDVLRLWSAYSGGDEGLKENTRFKKPNRQQARMLRKTLDNCYNLEDSFKTYREKWLKVLFYLNPMIKENQKGFPELYLYTSALRNNPKTLETFNAKVERLISEVDPRVFELLNNRAGVFTRRLDHLVRVFGLTAIEKYVSNSKVNFMNVITAYNHFSGRDKESSGRSAILASSSESNLVTYKAVEPLASELVTRIKKKLRIKLLSFKHDGLSGKKVFIHRSLYYSPMSTNNRAASLSFDQKCIGETSIYDSGKTLRMYVHWEGKTDIDLSGFIINDESQVFKFGWNGYHTSDYVTYSGDNTGYAEKNAEYLDIDTKDIPKDIEWIISEARIYNGPQSFKGYEGKAHIGWMSVDKPEENRHWQPKLLENAKVLTCEASTAYLMAYHPRSKNVVYLDMAMGNAAVSNDADAIQMRMFLDSFVTVDKGGEISWDKLNQGHILQLCLENVVANSEEADIILDSSTSTDEISRLINA